MDEAIRLLNSGNATDGYRILASICENEPSNGLALWNIANSLHQSRLFPAAALAFMKVVHLNPTEAQALNLAGWNMHLSCRTKEAIPVLRMAVECNPALAYAHMNLSQVLCYTGEVEEGLNEARKALDLMPHDAGVQMAYGLCCLFNGKLAEGFAYYRGRYRYKMPELLNVPMIKWDGRHCETLFLLCEQGLGDCVQFMRYIPEVANRVSKVILFSGKELIRIYRNHLPANVEIQPMPRVFPQADMWCPLLEVPVALGLKDEDYAKFDAPYVHVSEYVGEKKPSPKFKVGIVWAGAPSNEIDQWRSIPLTDFVRLAEIHGIELNALQVGPRQEDIGRNGFIGLIKDLSPGIVDVQDTVDLISQLDLVITIDSSVAHIAGAMGMKVWVILNEMCADYRYERHRDDNRWYPGNMRVFRRTLDEGSWAPVMNCVKQALLEEMNK